MKEFTLYGTSACHLCEQAHDMLEQEMRGMAGSDSAGGGSSGVSYAEVAFVEVDIAADDLLFERYGIRIPVLLHPDGRELGWPFGPTELRQFLLS